MKEQLESLLENTINDGLYQIILSNPRRREESGGADKIKIRPVMLKGDLLFQETTYEGTKVYHKNMDGKQLAERIRQNLQDTFRQCEIEHNRMRATILVSKKGRQTITCRKVESSVQSPMPLAHNRTKKYILREGITVPFLVDLGVQTQDGKIVHARYDKFRQINRFLEFIEDILPRLPQDRTVQILDFGCGKSYLTFAIYYYLHELKQYDVEITGLDLKEDVIHNCNALSRKYGYEKLHFVRGDIAEYTEQQQVDMVVTLHACDTATDYALEKAVRWNAEVILSVPCCQHEVNRQIHKEELQGVLKYGIVKERISALVTDAVRAELLEAVGYEVDILEFIDMSHTPKNLLIRAVRREKEMDARAESRRERAVQEVLTVTEHLGIEPTLQKLLLGADRRVKEK